MAAAFHYNLFHDQIPSIDGEGTKAIINSDDYGRYQLVDVRQPGEYAQSHLPGALLIPLGDLAARHPELDAGKETIVYCRSGVRSKTGCQILKRLGIERVYNLKGGLVAYQGAQAEGNIDAGLEYFVDADFDSAYQLVFAMEAGLKNFYLALADEAGSDAERETLTMLARFEDSHMARLSRKFGEVYFDPEQTLAEGGLDVEQMLAYFGDQLRSREQILQLAMKLEAQAFDLYSRLAREDRDGDLEGFFQSMAADEQKHLAVLSRELDRLL